MIAFCKALVTEGCSWLAAQHTRSGDGGCPSPQTSASAGRSPLGSRGNGTKNVKVVRLAQLGEGVARELGAFIAADRLETSTLWCAMTTRLFFGRREIKANQHFIRPYRSHTSRNAFRVWERTDSARSQETGGQK